MTANTKRIRGLVIVFFVLLAVSAAVIIPIASALFKYEARMFEDIAAFEKLDAYVTCDLTPADDAKLKGLQPVASYTKEIKYKNRKYRVFAYVFDSVEDCQTYYQNCGGEISADWNFASLFTSGIFTKSTAIAYNETCAYRFEGGTPRASARAFDFITADFPLNLNDMLMDAFLKS